MAAGKPRWSAAVVLIDNPLPVCPTQACLCDRSIDFLKGAGRPREKRAVEFLGSSDLDFILATDDEEQFSRLERER